MKNIVFKFSLLVVITIISFPASASKDKVTLTVTHMDCVTCPVVVRAALYDLDGVQDVSVSMKNKTVNIKYDNEKHTQAELVKTVTQAGFPAKVAR